MNALLDLETKLTVLANNPCACKVCEHAARLAKHALRDVSPSATILFDLTEGSPEFVEAEKKFHSDEIIRLQEHYEYLSRGKCVLAPDPQLDQSTPRSSHTIITAREVAADALVNDPGIRDKLDYYRKHSMKPRMMHKRTEIKMKSRPRIPGTYIIK